MSNEQEATEWAKNLLREMALPLDEARVQMIADMLRIHDLAVEQSFRDELALERIKVHDLTEKLECAIQSLPTTASKSAKEESENKQNRGLDRDMDDTRAGQQPDYSGAPIAHPQSGGIFAKDAANWLRKRWPYRAMTTGGLPDESLQHFQPTREDIERWLVEYAENALPIRHQPEVKP